MKIENLDVARDVSKLRNTLRKRRGVIAAYGQGGGGSLRLADRHFATDKPSDDNYTYIDLPVFEAIKALLLSAIDSELARAEAGLKALSVEIDA